MKNTRQLIRTNIVADAEALAWVDQQTSGTALDRSKILRTLVAALRASGLDLTRFGSEQELAAVCTVGLRSAAAQFPNYTLSGARTAHRARDIHTGDTGTTHRTIHTGGPR